MVVWVVVVLELEVRRIVGVERVKVLVGTVLIDKGVAVSTATHYLVSCVGDDAVRISGFRSAGLYHNQSYSHLFTSSSEFCPSHQELTKTIVYHIYYRIKDKMLLTSSQVSIAASSGIGTSSAFQFPSTSHSHPQPTFIPPRSSTNTPQ